MREGYEDQICILKQMSENSKRRSRYCMGVYGTKSTYVNILVCVRIKGDTNERFKIDNMFWMG